jgi:hypothetical protein
MLEISCVKLCRPYFSDGNLIDDNYNSMLELFDKRLALIEKRIEKERKETVKRFLLVGVPANKVAEAMELSIEVVEALKNETIENE